MILSVSFNLRRLVFYRAVYVCLPWSLLTIRQYVRVGIVYLWGRDWYDEQHRSQSASSALTLYAAIFQHLDDAVSSSLSLLLFYPLISFWYYIRFSSLPFLPLLFSSLPFSSHVLFSLSLYLQFTSLLFTLLFFSYLFLSPLHFTSLLLASFYLWSIYCLSNSPLFSPPEWGTSLLMRRVWLGWEWGTVSQVNRTLNLLLEWFLLSVPSLGWMQDTADMGCVHGFSTDDR